MSELFMECEEEELEPWQRPAPQQVLIEDDDDEPIFVGVVSKNEKAVPPISPPPSKNNVEKQEANSAPSPASTLASSSIMLPLKIAGNAISTSSSGFTTLTPQPVIVNDQGLIVTQQLTSNNLIATLGNQYPPGTKFALVTAGQPQQLIQRFAQVTTAVPGVVHRPHVQQIRNNVVTLANVQNPTVYTAKPRLLQVNQATSLQTIALPGQATSLNKETLKRVLPVQQIDTAAKRFKDDVGQANVTNSLENGDIKKNCPNCKEEFLQQEALDCHMTSCQSKVEGNALLANNIVTHKRIMLVSEFYYGRFEGDPLMASPQRSSVTFKCQSCCKVLKSNIKFMNHMKHHLELEKQNNESWESHITCQHCYRQYTTPFHLQCHIESAHSPIESSTNCKICELAFESEQVLLEHMKDNHKPGEMPYVCQVCNYRSSFFSDVETHFRSAHVNTKDLLCPFCLRILRNGQCYMHHFMKHQKKGIHRCGKCRLNFLTYKDRIDHRAQVHKTFRKPSVLEGLPAGTKVTIRASLSAKTVAMSSSVDRSAVVLTPETLSNSAKIKPGGLAKSKRNISEAVKPKTVLKNKGNSDTNCNLSLKSMSVNGGCYTCIECNTKIDDFSSHFLLSSDCGACNYRTSCKVAIGNHMIRFHSTVNKSRFSKVDQRKHSSAMKLTLMCLNCDLLVDASGGDMMSKHLNDRTNHICKVIEEKGVKAETGVQDYSEAVRMKRKEILPKLKEARETGDIACQRHDKPIIVNQTAHQNNADTSDHSSKSLTILKSSPTETTIEPVQIEKIEHLPHAKVEQLQPLPVLPAAPEDSVGESAMQSVSSAVEDSPSKNVMQSVSSAVEDTPSKNVMQSVSSAVEDTPSKNVMQAGSSSCELDGVEDVEPIGDLNITENCQPDQISD